MINAWFSIPVRSVLVMTSSLLSPTPLSRGRYFLHKRRTCLLLAVFLLSLTATILIVKNNIDVGTSVRDAPKLRIKSKDDSSLANAEVVFNPMQYLNSKTVGPTCDATILIVITSAPKNAAQRISIRHSWAKRNEFNRRYDWQYVFAIARSEDMELQSQVASEMNQFNDILYADFIDAYRNLTVKVLHAMAWARLQCRYTKFFLKTDDDCFVNTVILPRLIQDYHSNAQDVYLGRVFTKPKDLVVLRADNDPWSLTRDEYPKDKYPPYVSGSGYLLTIDLVNAIVNRSRFIKPFPVEDAYMGVVLRALGVEPINSGRFTFQSTSWTVCNFLYLAVIHHVPMEYQEKYYQNAVNAQKLCHEPFISKWN